MAEQQSSGPSRSGELVSAERLDSWKEIAAHLKRGVTTVQRWEHQEGLPVYRHQHDKRGSVYAFKSELDEWWQKGRHRLAGEEADPSSHAPSEGALPAGVSERPSRWTWSLSLKVALVAALAVGAIAGWIVTVRSTASSLRVGDPSTIQLALVDELQNGPGSAVAVSPDGRYVVYVGWRDGVDQLFRRPLNELDSVPIRYTERARAPFFSPDGLWIGFFADGELKKAPLEGGRAVTISAAPGNPAGAAWGPDDSIVFALAGSGLWRVAAGGGAPTPITSPADESGEVDHRWPELLPDGRAVIFTIWSGSLETARLALRSLETGEQRVFGLGSNPRIAGTSHIMFTRADGLWASSFDSKRLNLLGSPARVLESIRPRHGGAADYHLARSGSLVYVPTRPDSKNALVWVDLKGRATPIAADRQLFSSPRVSPDGTRVAVVVRSREGAFEIWVYDVSRGTRTRLPADAASFDPVWTPDGTRITFASTRPGPSGLNWIWADGSAPPETLLKSEFATYPSSWSPDGHRLAFIEMNRSSGQDIWVLVGQRDRSRVLATPFEETLPRFSPDGRWLAYTSNESGRHQAYVEPYPRTGKRWPISAGSGREPIWARDGRTIYYRNLLGDQLFSIAVSLTPVFTAGRPSLVFEGPYEQRPLAGSAANYDVSPDGRGFVMIKMEEEPSPQQVLVVLNWLEQVKRHLPAI
jgi:serine/threonine-protein kinase